MKKEWIPAILLWIYTLVFIRSGIQPIDKSVWIVEALTSLIPVIILSILYTKKIRFSNLGYILMSFLPIMHIIGAHYTFAEVPFDRFNNLFGFTRNMYDRVAHFTVWFYAFGIAELLYIKWLIKSKFISRSYALFAIMALATAYELFEWWYAVVSDPKAGLAILWSQWDIRDAQKDMLMDTLGAVVWVILFWIKKR